MTDTVELLPCPFCGNDGDGSIEDALHVICNEYDWRAPTWSVQCDRCTATMGYSDTKTEAVTAWNTRPGTVPKHVADGLAEALADISRYAENPNMSHADCRIEAKISAEINLKAYRKAMQ
jgi:hypothetical protein